jgi:putative FmdB family regulatory protein
VPTYDFRCTRCGLMFEARRRFDEDASAAACPVDGAEAARLYSPPLGALVYGATTSTPVSSIRPPASG